MKKLVTVTGCFMLLCIVITSVILPSMPHAGATQQNVNTESVVQTDENTDGEKTAFIIKEYDGKIAVFEGQAEEPLFVSDVSVNNLPETDKQLLNDGIYVSSKKELNRLIEDYCS